MTDTTQPLFALYVVWHSEYTKGAEVAKWLYSHFGTDRYRNISGGVGVPVFFRHVPAPNSAVPLPIGWSGADVTGVVMLMDRTMAYDDEWMKYVEEIASRAKLDSGICIFPLIMDTDVPMGNLEAHALRWNRCNESDYESKQRILLEITHSFSMMLERHLEHLRYPDGRNHGNCLKRVKIFLSHSKHDIHGVSVAKAIRDWLYGHTTLSSFFDVHDILIGESFHTVIDESIQNSTVVIIYTDCYSSREWCRYETIKAKRKNIPILVVDCLQTTDERSFPYMGNVPVIRMNPCHNDRVRMIAGKLLDEVFKNFLWMCSVEKFKVSSVQTTFLSRPPELISLADLPGAIDDKIRRVVYPDPPLGTEELKLFSDIDKNLQLLSLKEWQGKGSDTITIGTPKIVAISASESPDMKVLGLSAKHLQEAVGDIVMLLLAHGADLAYGGDLRQGGFTDLLSELLYRYRSRANANKVRVVNYLAWPVHISMTAGVLDDLLSNLKGYTKTKLVGKNRGLISAKDRQNIQPHKPDDLEWTNGLTDMRGIMCTETDARIVIGGRVEGYRGSMPGITEESLLSLKSDQPLFLLGGFGGCARDIAETLGLVNSWEGSRQDWPGRQFFKHYGSENLQNGLSSEENKILAKTSYIGQAASLILRGLSRMPKR